MADKFNWPIIGHAKIVKFLQHSIDRKHLSHAYFFYGQKNLGKKTIARYFAKSLLCLNNHQTTLPCHKCACCHQFDQATHPDLIIVKKPVDTETAKVKKNISLEQIKELQRRLSLSSFLKSYKIVIIEEANELSLKAADALLKILEEPPHQTIFILVASSLTGLPATLISRCQKIKFLPLAVSESYEYLVKEKKINRHNALNLALLAKGRPGLLEYFLDEKNLKDYYQELQINLELTTKPIYQKISWIEKNLSQNTEDQRGIVFKILQQWEIIIRDWLLLKNVASFSGVKTINNQFITELQTSSEKYDNHKLIKLLNQIKQSKIYLNNNITPKLILENFILAI